MQLGRPGQLRFRSVIRQNYEATAAAQLALAAPLDCTTSGAASGNAQVMEGLRYGEADGSSAAPQDFSLLDIFTRFAGLRAVVSAPGLATWTLLRHQHWIPHLHCCSWRIFVWWCAMSTTMRL